MKRILGFLIAFISVIALSFIYLIIGCLIKLEDRGPIFFRQKRLGYKGKVFEIYKFRTMVQDAESKGTGIFTNERDPRITRVGRFLRKTSLDELPQLFNVIRGDMSIVGPRPPLIFHPYKISEYDELKKKRFDVRPGITGLAQVSGRNNLTWDERIDYDVKYVKNRTLLMDFKIIILTVLSVFKKENIYGE